MNERKKKCVGLQRTWVSKRTVLCIIEQLTYYSKGAITRFFDRKVRRSTRQQCRRKNLRCRSMVWFHHHQVRLNLALMYGSSTYCAFIHKFVCRFLCLHRRILLTNEVLLAQCVISETFGLSQLHFARIFPKKRKRQQLLSVRFLSKEIQKPSIGFPNIRKG